MILTIKNHEEPKDNPILQYIENSKITCPDLFEKFSKGSNLSALDLGSSFPVPLICLYNNFDFKHFVAVDINDEAGCIDSFRIRNAQYEGEGFAKDASSFFDLYNICFRETEGEKTKIKSKGEFDKIFTSNFKLSTPIFTYLKQGKEKFDFINASNIFHFFNGAQLETLLSQTVACLKEEGIIYIRVQHKPNFDYARFKQLIKKAFNYGTLTEVWDGTTFKSATFINTTIQPIEQKKPTSVKYFPISVKPLSLPIEYKKVEFEELSWAKKSGKLPYQKLTPDANGYVTQQLLSDIEFDISDTTIINVGTGQGKTTSCYSIVDHYAKQDEFVVVMVSPYKKLINRDHEALKSKPYKVTSYDMIETVEEFDSILDSKVHIVTVNTLTGNPGDGNFELTRVKSEYASRIISYCKQEKKKVVFIFDELHAGIYNFKPQYVIRLFLWKEITHKVFILSATFTEATKEGIEYIARITDHRVKIFEADRHKLPTQSKLSIYLTVEDFSVGRNNLDLLQPLTRIIEDAGKSKQKVHIITAYKTLAQAITDSKSELPLNVSIQENLDYLLLTGIERDSFDKTKSNIGTTFYTGVDIIDPKDLLVIIMPSGKNSAGERKGGIFSAGASAIVQAVARLRAAGEIIIFTPLDYTIIKGSYTDYLLSLLGIEEVNFADDIKPSQEGKLIEDFYNKGKEPVAHLIEDVDKEAGVIDNSNIPYPSLKEFILNYGDAYLARRFEKCGKNFTPYILWAAFNDQFINTTIERIYGIEWHTRKLKLTTADIDKQLTAHFGDIKTAIRGKNLTQAATMLMLEVTRKIGEDGDAIKYDLQIDGKQFTKAPDSFLKPILSQIHLAIHGKLRTLTSEEYFIEQCFANAVWLQFSKKKLDRLQKAYYNLNQHKESLTATAIKNSHVLKRSDITPAQSKEIIEALKTVGEYDGFATKRIFELIRLDADIVKEINGILDGSIIDVKTIEGWQKKVFSVMTNLIGEKKARTKAGEFKFVKYYTTPPQPLFPNVL